MTTYAHVTGTTIDAEGHPPATAYDGTRWWDLRTLDPAALAATGWRPVTDTARPPDTATDTADRTLILVDGVPTVAWSIRPWTAAELAARTANDNRATLTDPARLQARLDRLATYDDDPDIVAALARQNNTAPTTAELNRLLKTMLRRDKRLTAALALLVRLLDPALLADIGDTADT